MRVQHQPSGRCVSTYCNPTSGRLAINAGLKICCSRRLAGWALPTPADPLTVGNRRSRAAARPSPAPTDAPTATTAATSSAVGRRTAAATGAPPRGGADGGGDSGAGGTHGGGAKEDWQQEVLAAFAEAEGLAELSIRAKDPSAQPWHTITVRPVALRGSRHLQVTTFTQRQSSAANHAAPPGDTAAQAAVLAPLLGAGGLGSVTLRSARRELTVQFTRRGKAIVHRAAPQSRGPLVRPGPGPGGDPAAATAAAAAAASPLLCHDRPKDTPIPAGGAPHPFLQRIGFQTADGRIRANMQDKFSQVNEFLKLLGHTGLVRDLIAAAAAAAPSASAPSSPSPPLTQPPPPPSPQSQQHQQGQEQQQRPLHILDCGCGSSHLSFGTYHYLAHVLGVPVTMTGVDVNAGLMAKGNATSEQLGLGGRVAFVASPIGQYSPPAPPDIVLALHACDTATDDALALAVKQSAPLIMAVPCCHAALHRQLAGRPPSARPPWAPLLRHGILRQRQLDLLTDGLRAGLLRAAGYRTDVVEFVSTEHTPRNLLLRAERRHHHQPPPPPPRSHASGSGAGGGFSRQQLAAAREYVELRDYWGVTPYLEVLLADELGPLLRAAAAAAEEADATDGAEAEAAEAEAAEAAAGA